MCTRNCFLRWHELYNILLMFVCARGLVLVTSGQCCECSSSCSLSRTAGLQSLSVLGKLSHAAFSAVLEFKCVSSLWTVLLTSFSIQIFKSLDGTRKSHGLICCYVILVSSVMRVIFFKHCVHISHSLFCLSSW